MKVSDDVYAVQRAYPQIWHACHTGHRKGATDGNAASERDVALLAHLDPAKPTTAGSLARHLGVKPSTLSAALDARRVRDLLGHLDGIERKAAVAGIELLARAAASSRESWRPRT